MTKYTCTKCNDTGFFRLDVPVGHPDFGKIVKCDSEAHTQDRVDHWLSLSDLTQKDLDIRVDQIKPYGPRLATIDDEVYQECWAESTDQKEFDEVYELAGGFFEALDKGTPLKQIHPDMRSAGNMLTVSNRKAIDMAKSFLNCHSRKSYQDGIDTGRPVAPVLDVPRGWFYVYGTNGNAKSVMVTGIYNELRERYNMAGLFCTLPRLLNLVREACFERQDRETSKVGDFISKGKEGRIDALSKVPVLVIDEFDVSDGKVNVTDFVTEVLQDILQRRYKRAMDGDNQVTVFASNCSPEMFPSLIADRMADGRSWLVRNTAPSRRQFSDWDEEILSRRNRENA